MTSNEKHRDDRSAALIARARMLYGEGRSTESLKALLDIPESFAWTANELVLRGRLTLLADVTPATPVKLADAELAFRQALELEEDNTDALLELAWYHHLVLDEAARAIPLFERVTSILEDGLAEALEGLSEAKEEVAADEPATPSTNRQALVEEHLTRLREQVQEQLANDPVLGRRQ